VAFDKISVAGSAAGLERRVVESTNEWRPRHIGPRFRWLDRDTIRIIDGTLTATEYGVKMDVLNGSAELTLHRDGLVGRAGVDRDPPGKGIVLRDIGVPSWLRGNGMAAVMTSCIFRELVRVQETSTFRIRMVRPDKAVEPSPGIRNVGVGVVAARLGLEPELDLNRVLDRWNITDTDIIPKEYGTPPGLTIATRSAPRLLVCLALDRETMKPLADNEEYVRLAKDERRIRQLAQEGLLVVTNVNYVLRPGRTEQFADSIAFDAAEARLFRLRVSGL
jgi:hypothetical protein